MRMLIRIGLLLCVVSLFLATPLAFSQSRATSTRPDGWQGPWPGDQQGATPAPQKDGIAPGPQGSSPSGKQVMEIPPRPQGMPEPPRQQAAIPPRAQFGEARPQRLLTVTVTDQEGRYVNDLRPEDFIIYEDDEPQRLSYFNKGAKEPLSMGILVDTSGSMVGKIERARFALRRLIEAVRLRDEVFIASFNTRPELLQDFTDSRLLLTQAVASLRPLGGTALYDAIIEGLRHVRQGRNQKKALIIISDGEDLNSVSTLEAVVETARRSGVVIYAIGIGATRGGAAPGGGFRLGPFQIGRGGFSQDYMDERTLREITEQAGGRLTTMSTNDVLANESALDDALDTISRELRLQYSLGYTPTRSGSHYRQTRVAIRRPDADTLTVRTQKGYASDAREQTARQSERRIQRW